MFKIVIIILLGLAVGPLAAAEGRDMPVQTVSFVDLERYSGLWYEVARLPNRFQKDCVGATAEYAPLGEDKISVLNTCYKQEGGTRDIQGEAKVASEDNARLKVTFNNVFFKLFSWLIKADYWVIDFAPDYSYAVVGTPNRKYLWILSREPDMPEELYQRLTQTVAAQGFDIDRIIRSRVPD